MRAVEIRLAQFERFFHDPLESARRAVAAVEPDQRTQVAHDFGGALDLCHRLFRGLGNRHDIDRRRAHRIVHQPRVSAGRHQRLIELMRDRGREFAHAAKPRKTRKRVLLQAQLGFGTPPLCN